MRTCPQCKIERPETDFKFGNQGRTRRKCRICHNLKAKEWYDNNRERVSKERKKLRTTNPEWAEKRRESNRKWMRDNPRAARDAQLRRDYGITLQDYERMFAEQDGLCGICELGVDSQRRDTLDVDHDHETGEVRGLLCTNCNNGIGRFQHDSIKLRKAARYLESE